MKRKTLPFGPPLAAGDFDLRTQKPAAGGGLNHLVSAIRRRMILIRALEGAGIGVAISAGFSLVLACALLAVGRSAMAMCATALVGGAVVGCAWSLLRRPTLLHAAAEADRQLDLADLLATALTSRDASDPWQQAVLAMAEDRCRGLSPSAVVLAKYGARAWGGVSLAAALVLAVGAVSTWSLESRARTPQSPQTVVEQFSEVAAPQIAGDRPRPSQTVVSSPNHQSLTPERIDDSTAASNDSSIRTERPGGSSGTGTSAAQTSSSTPAAEPRALVGQAESDGRGAQPAGGGTGVATPSPDATDVTGASRGTSSPSLAPAPPWAAASWSQDAAAAQRAVHEGRIPASCRDVVRRYFMSE